MQYTSAEAAKLLRKLNEQKEQLEAVERHSSIFNAAVGEDIESVRPQYDYAAIQKEFDDIDHKIRIVKHAMNIFNMTQVLPEFDMTIDQMLIYIPQLSTKKQKLREMSTYLPKEREKLVIFGKGMNVVDYRYTNYDVEQVKKDFEAVSDLLAKAQTALDIVNNTEKMDIDIEL